MYVTAKKIPKAQEGGGCNIRRLGVRNMLLLKSACAALSVPSSKGQTSVLPCSFFWTKCSLDMALLPGARSPMWGP